MQYLKDELESEQMGVGIIGRSPAIWKILDHITQAAQTDCTILIIGETGTGKEVLARAVHERSPRRPKPMIKVNCAAILKNLFESEFFGHDYPEGMRLWLTFFVGHKLTTANAIHRCPSDAWSVLARADSRGVRWFAVVPRKGRAVARLTRTLIRSKREFGTFVNREHFLPHLMIVFALVSHSYPTRRSSGERARTSLAAYINRPSSYSTGAFGAGQKNTVKFYCHMSS